MSRLVCSCFNVREDQIKEVYDLYPHLSPETIRRSLNIGMRCGSCRRDGCAIIDIKLEDLLKEYTKSSNTIDK